ncbi:MAG: alpha/beta hydrolase [Dehalococcoidales bacterium]|nr:MAG: alpha/beta hydrolase [Dehalococcoidales bacterium]
MEFFLTILIWVACIMAGLSFLGMVSLLGYKVYLRFSTRISTPNGINSLEEITLGGQKQWIFIRGKNKDNPVLLFLHGGPGEPIGGISSSRRLDTGLISHFTVVHWDQRGAGKSYHSNIPVSSMTFDRLVEDCSELIDYLRNKLNVQKVFLVSHSAGTIPGIKTAYKYPEKIYAYTGVAQIINDYEQQVLSYEFVVEKAEKSGNVKVQNAIKAIGPPPYETSKKYYKLADQTGRYGGFIHKNGIGKMMNLWFDYLTSPEYTLSEGINTRRCKGLHFTTNAMWEEITSTNITRDIQSLKVPVYFLMGKYDMITPTVQVEKFYDSVEVENGKRLLIFENSAHWPLIEEKGKYQDHLINIVLKDSLYKSGGFTDESNNANRIRTTR